MKILKPVLLAFAALVLLAGGFFAGSMFSTSRQAASPAPTQAIVIPQQQIQPTAVPTQQAIQPTSIPVQPTLPIPTQGWGYGMMNPNNTQQGCCGTYGWGMNGWYDENWRNMHDWRGDNWDGMHGWMNGYGGQNNPNVNPAPNTTPIPYPTPSKSVSFKNDVQPIFTARCVACHGGTKGLYLDNYENVIKGSDNGAVVIAGDVYNSRLAYYVYNGYMPYGSPALSAAEIQIILDWIATGAQNN